MVGKQILNYKLTREIGSGGMAIVYEALHTTLDTKVAIKILDPVLAANEGIRQRFIQEAKIMASLNHDGITRVIDFDNNDQHLAIVMEYLDGQALDEYIKQKGALNESHAKEIFIPILKAFEYAHSKGIVHRDVKPSNIFITREGKVKIMDFGIAKLVEDGAKALTQTGTQMGTPVYMSPEQVNDSKHIDQRTDIYSLGVTLWFMLAGKPPYDATKDSSFQIFNKIYNDPLPEIAISGKLEGVIRKATNKEQENRFVNCKEFLSNISLHSEDNLDETKIEQPIDILPTQQVESESKNIPIKKKNNQLLVALVLGVSSLILVLVSFIVIPGAVLISVISGVIGLIFTILAHRQCNQNKFLFKSDNIKTSLYTAYFLNSLWLLYILTVIFFNALV